MTRTTIKALWFGGGGILATWLAVSPAGTPATTPASRQDAADSAQQISEGLNTQADVLRARTTAVMPRPSSRNLFRFNTPTAKGRSSGPAREAILAQPVVPAEPAFPPLSLAGIAQDGAKRTAVITSGNQMYLVSDGEAVAGALTVVRVDAESVLLRNADGAEMTLKLQQ
jgi:type II secretory pathway component PulC